MIDREKFLEELRALIPEDKKDEASNQYEAICSAGAEVEKWMAIAKQNMQVLSVKMWTCEKLLHGFFADWKISDADQKRLEDIAKDQAGPTSEGSQM